MLCIKGGLRDCYASRVLKSGYWLLHYQKGLFFGGLSGVWRAAPGLCLRDVGRGFAWEANSVHDPA